MKGLKLYLILAGVLVIIYIISMLNRPKNIDWTETFSDKEKAPFGTWIIYNRVKDIFPGATIQPFKEPIYSVIADDSVKKSTYIIICGELEPTKADYNELVKYLKQGNDVFIAASYFGRSFEKNLNIKTLNAIKLDQEAIAVHFKNKNLDTNKVYSIDKGAGYTYFGKFDTLKATVIGENKYHHANFIKYSFGKGALYLASNPKLFSNYSLLKKQGAGYAEIALSNLKKTNRVIWDEYYTQGDGNTDDSPMGVFLSIPALSWAYYITLCSLLIYVLFEIKRTQRIIPLIEPLENKTLEFVNVVGQVYYEKRDNANISNKKIQYFLEFLREEYQLKTNNLDKEFVERLSAKLNLEVGLVNELVSFINTIYNQSTVSDRELIHLNKLIEQFYIKSR